MIAAAAAILAAQLFRPDQTNPASNPAYSLENSSAVTSDAKRILQRSCTDCHSNNTAYPWYAHVSPFSWFLDGHIRDGRRELNFSEWGAYESRRKTKTLEEICEQVQEGSMPLRSYLWVHRDAVLQEGDAVALCNWAEVERALLEQ